MGRFDFQSRLVCCQVIAHRLDRADLRADLPRLQMPGDPVMDEALAETHDFDICGASSPDLALSQNPCPGGILFHCYLHLMKTDTERAKLFQKEGITFL
jgi:hypothetical protein